jgi:mitochondrial chaperone BCS1
MFGFLIEQIKTNPILVGGIGTVVFGSLMFLLKNVPLAVYRTVKRLFTIELTLTSENGAFTEVMELLTKRNVKAFSRLFTVSYRGNIISGYGTSYAIWRGRLIVYDLTILKSDYRVINKVQMTMFSRNVSLFNKLMEESKKPPIEPVIKVFGGSGFFDEVVKKTKRPLSSVFCAGDALNVIKNRIDWFLANEAWYSRRGIPYKLVILLHGKPGCGKSSIIFSLASDYSRNLGVISNLSTISSRFAHAPENSFLVIEDIDMILEANRQEEADKVSENPSVEESKKKTVHKNILHDMINTLDGLATPHGLILFITTNYKDRLDSALIRKGRVDLDIEIGLLDSEAAGKMFMAFYGQESFSIIEPYLNGKEFRKRTGADLQAIFMTENDPYKAVGKMNAVHLVSMG